MLAAGAGSRFGLEPGAKLLADVDGQPLLARVLAAVREFGPVATVVVLGHGADAIEHALDWHDEIRVRNHAPERGLASSLHVGIDALRALREDLDGTFIVLGDQPRLRAEVLRALAAAAGHAHWPGGSSAGRAALQGPGPRNPVLFLRPAWGWVDELERRSRPGLPSSIATPTRSSKSLVAGVMPDVDEPSDLERLRAPAD